MTVGWPLELGDPAVVRAYLAGHGWLDADEPVVRVEVAGPGNMNLVRRVVTPRRSLVVKQGRPFVEKYPQIDAPVGRTAIEAQWYALAGRHPGLAERMPGLIGVDEADQVLVLTDLGPATDCTGVYAGERLRDDQLHALVGWLATLHRTFRGDRDAARLDNRAMRLLNHEHIFEVPLRPDNGLDLDALTPGLAGLAAALCHDRWLLAAMARLGSVYLGAAVPASGPTLLHGDFYPGSWLSGPGGPYVIDPEFGFFGPPEVDVGVLLAHLELSGHSQGIADRVLATYLHLAAGPGGGDRPVFDADLAWGFAGAEVIRRLLGVAQLPLDVGLAAKAHLLDEAAARLRTLA